MGDLHNCSCSKWEFSKWPFSEAMQGLHDNFIFQIEVLIFFATGITEKKYICHNTMHWRAPLIMITFI